MSNVAMENESFDVEAQQSLLTNPTKSAETTTDDDVSARRNWQRVSLFFRSTQLFIKSGDNSAPDRIIASSSPNSNTRDFPEIVAAAHEISIDEDSTRVDILSPARSTTDKYEDNIELQNIQKKNVAEIVKKKELQRLLSFGGVQVVAEALNTDIEKGISYSPNHAICQAKPCQLRHVVVTFFPTLLKNCNNYTIILLFFITILSLTFGIAEDGPQSGWHTGLILIIILLILVLLPTIRTLWENKSNEKLENCWHSKGRNLPVQVVRRGELQGGIQFIPEIDLVVGDIVVLTKGDLVPADGLLVTDQAVLELDEAGFITTVDQGNPFLLNYGSRVINGNARMLVTSTGMDTVWGEMMCQAVESAKRRRNKFEIKLHKLNIVINFTGLMVGMFMMIALFVWYKIGKHDEQRSSEPDSKGELLIILSVVLGITEGISFVVATATIFLSNKIRADHQNVSVRHDQACVNMGCVNTICTDKFGGLTLNEVEIDKFCVGDEFISDSSVVASNVLEGFCDGIGTITHDCESKLVPLLVAKTWWEKCKNMKTSTLGRGGSGEEDTHNIFLYSKSTLL